MEPALNACPAACYYFCRDHGKEARLTAFFDAAHGNNLRNRRSTTGYAFVLSGGVISYRCKTQSITATSSTEAEFLSAVLTAKQAKCLRSVLKELGFEQSGPTALCCENQSAINMANARVPTERSAISIFSTSPHRTGKKLVTQLCLSFLGLLTPVMISPSLLDGFCMRDMLVALWDIIKDVFCMPDLMLAHAMCVVT